MIQGLYTAASGMMAVEERQAVIANNVANAATPGFKRHAPVQLGFYGLFEDALRRPGVFNREAAPGGGVKTVETYPDLAGGALRNTENPLNAALQGPGYFVVETPRGDRYTRSGDFTMDAQGHLATPAGHKVLGQAGPVDVRGGSIRIAQDGRVTVDGLEAGVLRLVEFEAPERLEREGDSLFAASDEVLRTMAAASASSVQQGRIELSNVEVPREMIGLTLGLRAYEANQRVMSAIDTTMGRLIDQVATPA